LILAFARSYRLHKIELRPVHDLDTWKDRDIDVRVLKLNRKRGNVVVSRRAILEEEQKSKRDELMASLSEGSIITGRVKNVTDYGVFVDLGGMDGLLHVSDLCLGTRAASLFHCQAWR